MNDKRLKSIVQGLVKEIVDYPAYVNIEVNRPNEALCELVVYTHSDDLKMVIGKGGKNVQAIRTLIYAMAAKSKVRCYVTVEENLSDLD
tara:strand:- start:2594 stop:2860 length:267 start_codon:yes stop_codon:yes gene_type:complete